MIEKESTEKLKMMKQQLQEKEEQQEKMSENLQKQKELMEKEIQKMTVCIIMAMLTVAFVTHLLKISRGSQHFSKIRFCDFVN